MNEERIIKEADFNDSVTTYWLINGALVLLFTFVGILLIPFWWFGGKWITKKYLESHKCTLTDRNLHVAKGILNQTEKTIPLDRITDVGIVQGPIMRYLDIEMLSVETAGQSSAGSLVRLTGIQDGRAFKDAVLKQRDLVTLNADSTSVAPSDAITSSAPPLAATRETTELLQQIRDTLQRIESKIEKS